MRFGVWIYWIFYENNAAWQQQSAETADRWRDSTIIKAKTTPQRWDQIWKWGCGYYNIFSSLSVPLDRLLVLVEYPLLLEGREKDARRARQNYLVSK